MFARLPDGRTIEEHYQCDVKAWDIGGVNWRAGKGRPPKDTAIDLWEKYLDLWRVWAKLNPNLMCELASHAASNDFYLSDVFASTTISQARALATILNELN